MEINKLAQSEKADAINLVWSVFSEFEAPDYSEEGIDTFRKFISNADEINKLEIFGAYEKGNLVGVIATRNEGSHISLFFVDKKYHRQGIGRKLFEAVLSNSTSEIITVHSSPYARDIYCKLGFVDTDTEQIDHGICYIPMKYKKAKDIMGSTYTVIDETNWKRALHCQIFRNSVEPSYCITLELDITDFLAKIRMKKYSFTFALIYAVSKCANNIEEFRYRFLDGQIVLYDRINTAFTYLDKDTELFKVVNVEMQDTLEDYIAEASLKAKCQKEFFTGPLGNDVFQFSPMPWISYTHISHTNSGKKDNATPLFDWGKYFERDGKWLLPFSVQVHHSFVDGIHIGKFVESVQAYLTGFKG